MVSDEESECGETFNHLACALKEHEAVVFNGITLDRRAWMERVLELGKDTALAKQ